MGVTQVIIGAGCMIIPIILQMLIEEYGTRGTQAIIAAVGLHSLLCAVVQHPVEMHVKRKKPAKVDLREGVSEKDGNTRRESWDSEMRVVSGKTEILKESQTCKAAEDICQNGVLKKDKSISYDSINEVIFTGDSHASDADVINVNVKSDTHNEFQTNINISQNSTLLREEHTESIKEQITPGNVNEVLVKSSDINKLSQITVVNYDRNQTECDKCDTQEVDSAEHLLTENYLKIHYVQKRISTDLGSTTTGNPVSISDSRATVTSLRSWTSSCERRRRTNDEGFFKSADSSGAPIV
jgi:hypothetical protein